MKNNALILFVFLVFQTSSLYAQEVLLSAVTAKPERVQEQLIGSVKTVLVEFSKIKKIDDEWIPEDFRTPWLSTTYNRLGFRIVEDQIYVDKSLNFTSVFTYAEAGKLSEGIEYDYKKKVTFQWAYKHHLAENKIEETRMFPNGQPFSSITYLYDKQGNMTEEKHKLVQTGNHFTWVYGYNPMGKKVEESYYLARPEGREGMIKSLLNFRVVFRYNDQGHIVEETRYNAAGQITTNKHFQYKYDETGNWISQTAKEPVEKAGGSVLEPTEITYRTITYYTP